MIVRDEEPVLARALGAASRFADEIIVVDTGSADRTREIARRYTDRVYDFPWIDDFAAARNFAQSFSSCDFVMWLDADDVIYDADIEKLLRLKDELTDGTDVVMLLYKDASQGLATACGGLRDRLVRRALGAKWIYAIHEAIPILDEYRVLNRPDIVICHDKLRVNEPGRNLRIFEKLLAEGAVLDHRLTAYYCRELSEAGRHDEAVAAYNRLLRDGANVRDIHYARFFYARSMTLLRRYRELLEELLRETEPPCPLPDESLCCMIGEAYLRLKAYDDARTWYERALRCQPDYGDGNIHLEVCRAFEPWYSLALIEANAGNHAAAKSCFDRAEALCPEHLWTSVWRTS